jgi:hypothetical protein
VVGQKYSARMFRATPSGVSAVSSFLEKGRHASRFRKPPSEWLINIMITEETTSMITS